VLLRLSLFKKEECQTEQSSQSDNTTDDPASNSADIYW
jgi:hypothetical protein